MQENREKFIFPTRNYPYRYPVTDDAGIAEDDPTAGHPQLEAGHIYRFILGVDEFPRTLTDEEAQTLLRDSFAELLLKRGSFPQTARELFTALDTLDGEAEALPEQKVFLIAEGGQIPWSEETANLNRQFRFAVSRSRNNDARLLVSCSTVFDSDTQFLQVLSWDAVNEVYNYYERREGVWIWAGNSHYALLPDSRGQGPFDSHVNGSLVMKELRAPWCNWHSMNAAIRDEVLAPDDSLRNEPFFLQRVGAQELERSVVRPGIERWNRARFRHSTSKDGKLLRDVAFYFRQILQTTTINLVSSNRQSNRVADDEQMDLPITFFINTEAFFDYIELEPDISPITVIGKFYRDSLNSFEFTLRDGKPSQNCNGEFSQKTDTFFAFLVPEPAFEDLNVLALLLEKKIISRRFAACLLMVDFPNPIFSPKRDQLMQFVPQTANLFDEILRSDFEAQFVSAIESLITQLAANHAAHEFLANWRLPENDWKQIFEKRIEDYFAALHEKSQSGDDFNSWTRLAESRRREFRRRPLAEFCLTTSKTNISENAPLLEMKADGTIQAKQ